MSDKDQTLADRRDPEHPLHILWWGPPKSGKTVAAHTFPRTRTLDLDDGMESLNWAFDEGYDGYPDKEPSDIVYRTIREHKSPPDLFRERRPDFALDRATDAYDDWLEDSESWDTLIVDSATELSQFCINKALFQLDKHMDSFTESVTRSKNMDFLFMAQQDWQPAKSLFIDFINMVRGLDKHLIIICHEYEETDEDGNVRGKYPLLIGQHRQRIPKDFDEVYYQKQEGTKANPKFMTQTVGSGRIIAGSRLGLLDYKEENLTYDRLVAARQEARR